MGWRFRLAEAAFVAVVFALVSFRLSLQWALIRPVVLAFGRPATAVVTGKDRYVGTRTSGAWVGVNYQYSPDYAPRVDVDVTWAAYDAFPDHGTLPIHYLQGCPSCVAIDDDRGSSRGQLLEAGGILGAALLLAFLSRRSRRPRLA